MKEGGRGGKKRKKLKFALLFNFHFPNFSKKKIYAKVGNVCKFLEVLLNLRF